MCFFHSQSQIASEHKSHGWNLRFFWVDINTWGDLSRIWGLSAADLPKIVVFDPTTLHHYPADREGTDRRG